MKTEFNDEASSPGGPVVTPRPRTLKGATRGQMIQHHASMAESLDAVWDLIDDAHGVLTYEEREALADALLAAGSSGAAAVCPRSAKHLRAPFVSRDASVRRRYCVIAGKGSVLRARASVQAV
jgi:hypothetical protein